MFWAIRHLKRNFHNRFLTCQSETALNMIAATEHAKKSET